MNKISDNNCQCSCGDTTFTILAPALTRAYCHCTICQQFNDAAFADVVIYNSKAIALPKKSTVDFNTYKAPPALKRGKCKNCAKPVIEFLTLGALTLLAVVPAEVIGNKVEIPAPSCHLFYNQRHKDHNDYLPKYSGYLTSQLALTHRLLTTMLTIKRTPYS